VFYHIEMNDSISIINTIASHHKHPKLYSNENLTTSTRKKASEMLKQENLNSKKSQLECLLGQQFQSKYGSRQSTSQLNSIIKSVIHDFVAPRSMDEISKSIEQLESLIKTRTDTYKTEVQSVKSARENEERNNTRERERVDQSSQNLKSTTSDIDIRQWSVINAVQNVSFEEKTLREKEQSEKNRLKYRVDLENQLRSQEERKKFVEEEKHRSRTEIKRSENC
jgi:hypothetical protein